MVAIDHAIHRIVERLRRVDMPIRHFAKLADVGVGTIWALRQAGDATTVNITTDVLRRVESALDELDRERSAGGGADDPEHPVPPHSRKQMAACHE